MFYHVGSSDWTMKVDDKTDKVAANDIGRFAEKYHDYFAGLADGYTVTADFYDKAGDVVSLFVKKVKDVVTINPMIFEFADGSHKMTDYVEFCRWFSQGNRLC